MNEFTGQNFTPGDLFVGQNVVISSMPMLIMRADEYTLKHMEMNPETWPMSSLDCIMEKLGGLDWAKLPDVCGPEQFREAVESQLRFSLLDHELITVLRSVCEESSSDI